MSGEEGEVGGEGEKWGGGVLHYQSSTKVLLHYQCGIGYHGSTGYQGSTGKSSLWKRYIICNFATTMAYQQHSVTTATRSLVTIQLQSINCVTPFTSGNQCYHGNQYTTSFDFQFTLS